MRVSLKPYIEVIELSKRLAQAEADKDVMRDGESFIRITNDGRWERISPHRVTIKDEGRGT